MPPIISNTKIIKKGGSEPDQFELSIAQALLELQNNSDLKAQLRELYITKAKEIELFGKKVSESRGFSCQEHADINCVWVLSHSAVSREYRITFDIVYLFYITCSRFSHNTVLYV